MKDYIIAQINNIIRELSACLQFCNDVLDDNGEYMKREHPKDPDSKLVSKFNDAELTLCKSQKTLYEDELKKWNEALSKLL